MPVSKALFMVVLGVALPAAALRGEAAPGARAPFIDYNCIDCHDNGLKKGGLDLMALRFEPSDPANFATWVMIHDRVKNGEMPPKEEDRPDPGALAAFTSSLAADLVREDRKRTNREGRATQRRLNRYEYENVLRDLLRAPWLDVKNSLPEDGESHRFNKIGDRLDVSHVQLARYIDTAERALREAMATHATRPDTRIIRHHARDQRQFMWPMKDSLTHPKPERATFPVLGFAGQPDVRAGKAPPTVGEADPETRNLEGMGVIASSYEPLEPIFEKFRAPISGRYKLRFLTHSIWVGAGKDEKWHIADLDDVSVGRRSEPVTIYAEAPPGLLRRLGAFDATPEARIQELDINLVAGETIRPDAARLIRSRPGDERWRNPLATLDGQPGVVFRWLEVEGPIFDSWPTAGHKLLFGDLPLKEQGTENPGEGDAATSRVEPRRYGSFTPPPGVEVISDAPMKDASRLLRRFVERAYRRPVGRSEAQRFLPVVERALEAGHGFTDAMLAAYTAILCSPGFLYIEETPGPLDDHALASRLAFFLWNSAPDDELRRLAADNRLHHRDVLRAQVDRLLDDPRSQRFVEAFLDYWLDLKRMTETSPDASLYPDYYLDDLLSESALDETRQFFSEMLEQDLPARTLVASDFAMINERLATHYGLPAIEGVAIRRVALPGNHARGGLLTQASVLKVTANGTTTSPVLRGVWIAERILGQKSRPPPPGTPAVEPDIRGATTIREQLDRHRSVKSCNACHVNIDPPGFALESFDIMGGWRDSYRALGDAPPEPGIGKGGQKFVFHRGLPVDASGELPDGRTFADVRDFKRLLLADEAQIARNLARQLTLYATGAAVGFGDRAEVERILEHTAPTRYGIRSLVHAIAQSELFLNK